MPPPPQASSGAHLLRRASEDRLRPFGLGSTWRTTATPSATTTPTATAGPEATAAALSASTSAAS